MRLSCPKCKCRLRQMTSPGDATLAGPLVIVRCNSCGLEFHGEGRDRSQALRRVKAAVKKAADQATNTVPRADVDATRRLR